MLKRKNLKKKRELLEALNAFNHEVFRIENLAMDQNDGGVHSLKELEDSLLKNSFKVGDLVKGKIVEIKEDHILVEIGYKSEGLIPISEFSDTQTMADSSQTDLDEAFEGNSDKVYNLRGYKRHERHGFRKGKGAHRNSKVDSMISPFSSGRPFVVQKRSEILKNIHLNEEVEVYIDRIEDEHGRVVLSKRKADLLRIWNKIAHAAETGEPIEGFVSERVKGGLSIDVGMKAFLPGSQIDTRPVRDTSQYVGKTYQFKVIKFNKKRGNIVLSRRAILENERKAMSSQAFDSLKEGTVVKGFVKSITDYGAFIDLGGMDGLLHITDMSWGRIKHPTEVIKENEEIDVVVLKFDVEKKRVSLGLKQLMEDPWKKVPETFVLGKKVKGKIISITDYGAFVRLDDGVEGLIHISEMSWSKKKIKHPSQVVKIGEEVDVQVLEIDSKNKKISLGLKQLMPNPWDEIIKKYPVGTVLEGEVRSITAFGIFVSVNEGVDGLVHISDFSWTRRINHPSKEYNLGDKLKVVVLGIDTNLERFSLGIKQLEPNPWAEVEIRYPIGSRHNVKAIEATDFGIFVELEKGIDGLIHISELSTKRINKTDDVVKVGETVQAEIMSIDKKSRKIGLSIKAIQLREQKEGKGNKVTSKRTTSNQNLSSSKTTSLEDAFRDALKEANTKDKKNQNSSSSHLVDETKQNASPPVELSENEKEKIGKREDKTEE